MTRIGCYGDIHISLPKLAYDYEQDTLRYTKLKESIIKSNYDYNIFVGDLFDKARPSLEEIKYVTEFLEGINNPIIIDGNHEAVTKTLSTYDYINIPNIRYIPNGRLTIDGVVLHFLGWTRLHIRRDIPKCDILFSHFRGNIGIIKEEINVQELAKKAKIVVAGDIHKQLTIEPNVYYTSSPYDIHYTKQPCEGGYIELELNNGEFKLNRKSLNLPRKVKLVLKPSEVHRIDFEGVTDRLFIEVTGTLEELERLPKHNLVKYSTKIELPTIEINTPTYDSNILPLLVHTLHNKNTDLIETIYKEVM